MKRNSIDKYFFLTITFLLYLSATCLAEVSASNIDGAQETTEKSRERIVELKRHLLLDNKKLNLMQNIQLNNEEAKIFWPIYDEYQEQIIEIEINRKKIISIYIENISSISEKQALKIIDELFSLSDMRQDTIKRFSLELEDVLSSKLIFNYLMMEDLQSSIDHYNMMKIINPKG